ncbi:MAG: translation initiation factor IF-2 N-terminal domain-containing protein, partial [Prochlorococcus sp.]
MTSNSSKIRIYELSKELALENKDVLNAAEKLSIAAKSHSSSISDEEAKRIRDLLRQGIAASPSPQSKSNSGKAILSLKKAADSETKDAAPPNKKATTSPQISHVKQASPARPTGAQQPATGSASRPAPPSRPAAKPTTAISPSKAAAQPAKAPVPVNRPVTPSRPAAPAAKATAIPSSPKPPNTGIQTSRTSQTSTSGEARKVDEGAPRPKIISRPESPAARIAPPAKPSLPS